jgi:O-methyltransferase involved in polyketide biosynthesis
MISARFLDDQVLLALNSVNTGRDQPYNQLVLVGDGYCTRPFRLNVPIGTVIYLVAPGEVHERAEALLAEQPVKARVPRGCLLKRIDCNFIEGNSCANTLERAGYRADRVSVWALQVNLFN